MIKALSTIGIIAAMLALAAMACAHPIHDGTIIAQNQSIAASLLALAQDTTPAEITMQAIAEISVRTDLATAQNINQTSTRSTLSSAALSITMHYSKVTPTRVWMMLANATSPFLPSIPTAFEVRSVGLTTFTCMQHKMGTPTGTFATG
ncbi:MAG: hypothetical protein US82_C0036G0002 [Parcubacteria group bacterium GW2011_GWC1_38_22]|nr:MAG: hypothetical protein US82_C0036G0002 [Parcubacteria group bacterium GW2011_GWC1_38_22]